MESIPSMSAIIDTEVAARRSEVENNEQRAERVRGNGKTCHQCRQKIKNVAASCKNVKDKGKTCLMKFCRSCLKNRYGEDAEEKEKLDDWKCPKCRGNCNCSCCRKKRGCQPTGRQINAAKDKGYSCVSDMLGAVTEDPTSKREHVVGPESPDNLISDAGDIAPKIPVTDLDQELVHTPNAYNIHAGVLCQTTTDSEKVLPFPEGTMLTNILDIELPPEDVGHALQFLEFCSVFQEVLDVNEGEPEAVLQELVHEQNTHYGKIIQFHVKMLIFIRTDSINASLRLDTIDGANSWLKSLWNSISEPILESEELQLDVLCESNNVYQNLEFSKKLQILKFICDECLNTQKIVNYIDEEYLTFAERGKEARKQFSAAKKKIKDLQQELQNEKQLHDEMLARENDDPDSILRHEALISKIEDKLKQVQDEMLVAKGKVPKRKQRPETLRTDPIFIDSSGKKFWKLKCFSEEEAVLLQDVKPSDEANSDERWFVYGADQKHEIEDYISSSRRTKRSKTRNVAHTRPNESSEANM